ncbi:MAG: hypothetical protein ACO32Z_04155, partial [Gemmatimonadaceae bacterium]
MTRSRVLAATALLTGLIGVSLASEAQPYTPATKVADLTPRLLPAPRELVTLGAPQRFQTTIGFAGGG